MGNSVKRPLLFELHSGTVNSSGDLVAATAVPRHATAALGQGRWRFVRDAVGCCRSGLQGFTIRVLPHHADLPTPFLPGLIIWAGATAITE